MRMISLMMGVILGGRPARKRSRMCLIPSLGRWPGPLQIHV